MKHKYLNKDPVGLMAQLSAGSYPSGYIVQCRSDPESNLEFFRGWEGYITQCHSDPESNFDLGGQRGGTLPNIAPTLNFSWGGVGCWYIIQYCSDPESNLEFFRGGTSPSVALTLNPTLNLGAGGSDRMKGWYIAQ